MACFDLNGLTIISVITQILLNQPKYTYPATEKLLNLMFFYSGHYHTIIVAKDSSWLDVENKSKHNQFIMSGPGN